MTISDTDNPLSQFEGPSNEDIYKDFADRLSNYGSGYYFLKEVWLSDKVDVVTFMRVLNDGMKNPIWSDSYYYYHSTMSLAGDATLCVPAKQGEAVRALMARHAKFPPYTVRTYTGNVAEAQKIGLKATKNPCRKHNFWLRYALPTDKCSITLVRKIRRCIIRAAYADSVSVTPNTPSSS